MMTSSTSITYRQICTKCGFDKETEAIISADLEKQLVSQDKDGKPLDILYMSFLDTQNIVCPDCSSPLEFST